MTHNYPGLTDTLQRLGIKRSGRSKRHSQAIGLWKKGNDGVAADCQHLLSDIGAKGRYLITALNKAKRR